MTDFRNRPESPSTMLTKYDRELAIQLFKNCIKHNQSQKIIKLVQCHDIICRAVIQI
jgi:hypothetical protein